MEWLSDIAYLSLISEALGFENWVQAKAEEERGRLLVLCSVFLLLKLLYLDPGIELNAFA